VLIATYCNLLQLTATHCNSLQLTHQEMLAGSPMSQLMKQVKMQCLVDVKSPEEARARR